jgi:hypothetical protein
MVLTVSVIPTLRGYSTSSSTRQKFLKHAHFGKRAKEQIEKETAFVRFGWKSGEKSLKKSSDLSTFSAAGCTRPSPASKATSRRTLARNCTAARADASYAS